MDEGDDDDSRHDRTTNGYTTVDAIDASINGEEEKTEFQDSHHFLTGTIPLNNDNAFPTQSYAAHHHSTAANPAPAASRHTAIKHEDTDHSESDEGEDVDDEEEDEDDDRLDAQRYEMDPQLDIQRRFISHSFANLFTIAFLVLIYFNFVLFESYVAVFLYSGLATEALWSTKMWMIGCIKNSENGAKEFRSPRDSINSVIHWVISGSRGWIFIIMLATIGVAVFAGWAVLSGYISIEGLFGLFALIVICVVAGFVFDRKVYLVLRMHRILFADETWVASVLIFGGLIGFAIVSFLFIVLSLKDARLAVEGFAGWATHTINETLQANDHLAEVWLSVMQNGKHRLQIYADSMANDTISKVLIMHVSTVFENARNGTSESSPTNMTSNVCSATDDPALTAMESLKENLDNLYRIFTDLLSKFYSEGDGVTFDMIKPFALLFHGLLKNSLGYSVLVFSFLMAFLDFGVRIGFFITLLFFFLSSNDTILHAAFASPKSTLQQQQSQRVPRTPGPTRGNGAASLTQTNFSVRQSAIKSSKRSRSDPATWTSDRSGSEGSGSAAAASNPNPMLNSSMNLSPVSSSNRRFHDELRKTIQGLLWIPIKNSVYHACATLIIFFVFGLVRIELPYPFLASLLVLCLCVFPIVYAHFAIVPWYVMIVATNTFPSGWIWATILFLVCYNVFSNIHLSVYSQFEELRRTRTSSMAHIPIGAAAATLSAASNPIGFASNVQQPATASSGGGDGSNEQRVSANSASSNPYSDLESLSRSSYVTSLSVFFGTSAFGIQGIILGPLMVSLAITCFRFLAEGYWSAALPFGPTNRRSEPVNYNSSFKTPYRAVGHPPTTSRRRQRRRLDDDINLTSLALDDSTLPPPNVDPNAIAPRSPALSNAGGDGNTSVLNQSLQLLRAVFTPRVRTMSESSGRMRKHSSSNEGRERKPSKSQLQKLPQSRLGTREHRSSSLVEVGAKFD